MHWILDFIPAIAIHLMLLSSIAFYIASTILAKILPFVVNPQIFRLFATMLLLGTVFLEGRLNLQNEYRGQIEQLNVDLANARAKSEEINTKVEYVYVDRVQKVKDTQIVYRDRVKAIAADADKKCTVDPRIIDVLNQAAAGNVEKKQ